MGTWVEWHEAYEHPGSSLSRRLEVVTGRLRFVLQKAGPMPSILSLCSGDGRDVIGTLASHPDPVRRAVLVEADAALAARARRAADTHGLSAVEVRCRDAGAVASFVDLIPVDVLLLCGIFGNIEHAMVKRVVDLIPRLVTNGGFVIWTRGGSEPDRRPEIRKWFSDAGHEELAFDGAPEPFGVGLNRVTGPVTVPSTELPVRVFSFR